MRHSIPILEICTLSGIRNSDIVVERFSSYLKRHKDIHSPHRHNFYHMVLFTKGEGFHSIDFNRFLIEPYQIYFMIPGQVHSWNFDDEVDGYVVNFSAEFFQSFLLRADYLESFSFFNGIAEDGVINLNESLKEPVQYLFEDM